MFTISTFSILCSSISCLGLKILNLLRRSMNFGQNLLMALASSNQTQSKFHRFLQCSSVPLQPKVLASRASQLCIACCKKFSFCTNQHRSITLCRRFRTNVTTPSLPCSLFHYYDCKIFCRKEPIPDKILSFFEFIESNLEERQLINQQSINVSLSNILSSYKYTNMGNRSTSYFT